MRHWHRHRFDYLDLAADLPALLPGSGRPPAPAAPPRPRPSHGRTPSRPALAPSGWRIRARRRPGRARPQTPRRA